MPLLCISTSGGDQSNERRALGKPNGRVSPLDMDQRGSFIEAIRQFHSKLASYPRLSPSRPVFRVDPVCGQVCKSACVSKENRG